VRTPIGHSVNRRSFLRGAAALAGALSLPWPTKEEPGHIPARLPQERGQQSDTDERDGDDSAVRVQSLESEQTVPE
jgi:FtsP/CotA-like multicopper oxidase with cupredoxin domain